jgi:hypothetical protein
MLTRDEHSYGKGTKSSALTLRVSHQELGTQIDLEDEKREASVIDKHRKPNNMVRRASIDE